MNMNFFPELYTEREQVILDFTVKICKDAYLVTDEEFENLKQVLHRYNLLDPRLSKLPEDELARHTDSQIVELTWLIGHFILLNKWFTVLQVPDETSVDEDNFLAAYEEVVHEDIRARNAKILNGDF